MHGVFILHTIISSVARNGNTGRTFSQRTLYTIQRISIPLHCHFERSEKSSLHSALSCSLRKRFPLFRCLTYGAIPVCQKDPSASLGMTLREYRSLTLPIYFPCNNDTREAPSTFAALLFFYAPHHTPEPDNLNPEPTTKKPQPKLELFCVRKTYLPNCASMVPAATAVPITPATFGPIACISR